MSLNPHKLATIDVAATPVFSRSGETLFHLRGTGLPQVWALNLATRASRQLTDHGEKIALLRRAPQDDRLIYGFDRGGDERQKLMLIDAGSLNPMPRPLTINERTVHEFGAWSPDGTQIAYTANERDEAHFDVYVQDADGGARSCVYRGTNILNVCGFHPDGKSLALLHDRGYGDMTLLILDIASGEAQPVPAPSPSNYQNVRWASDGSSLLAITDHGGSEFPRLCRLDPKTGAFTVVYAAVDREVDSWALSADGRLLATIENDRGYAVLRIGPIDGDRPEVSDLPRGVISEPTFSADGTMLACTVATPQQPASLWLWRSDGTVRPVWQPDSPPAATFADFALVDWETFDGKRIPGWLVMPPTPAPPDGHPAIVWVHGGPVGQTRPTFRPDIQLLVAQGFAVLMPNVRGSSGYGRSYTESDDVHRRLDSVTDLAWARQWLAGQPAINAERIGIMGQSYGGFMVMSAITEHPELWRAAVDYYGIADFVTLLATTGAWRRRHRAAEYGDPERDAALFTRISPIHHIDRVHVPVLIAHGHRDPRVPISESEQFVTALQERQKPVEYLTFDYAGHGFIRPDDKQRIYAAIAEFFTAHLR